MKRTARSASIAPRVAAALLAAACLAGALGCAATGPVVDEDELGLTLDLYARRSASSFARYRVEPSGTIHFGGGDAALEGRYTWSGPLLPGEMEQLVALVERHGWLVRDPRGGDEVNEERYEVTAQIDTTGERRWRRFTVYGSNRGVSEVLAVLDAAARRRNAAFLDALPKAGDERR